MTQPRRYLVRMVIFLVAVLIVAGVLHQGLLEAFLSNPALNGTILTVLILGIAYMMQQVVRLGPEVSWAEAARANRAGLSSVPTPRLLGPVARTISEQRRSAGGPPPSLSATAMRSLLDGLGARLDESRELSRYLIGLLVFLGLLGTFWGLLRTVGAVADVIGQLNVDATRDLSLMFGELQAGLQAPLSGMGTAFSSSLFGLAGSLVLGFMELQASQAQNRFYNEVEEWLSSRTRMAAGAGGASVEGGESTASIPVYLQALMDQMAENLEGVQNALLTGEDDRRQLNQTLLSLSERLSTLNDQMRAEQTLMVRLAENQVELKPMIQRLSEAAGDGQLGMDEASKAHLRNVEVYLGRLLEDLSTGRSQTVSELRHEIKVLARALGDPRSHRHHDDGAEPPEREPRGPSTRR